jgi:hypothetical protein
MKKEYVVLTGMFLIFVAIVAYIAIAGAGISPV